MSATTPIQDVRGDRAAQPARPAGMSLPVDLVLWLAVAGICAMSLMFLGAATADDIDGDSGYFVKRQAIFIAIGFAGALLLSRLDYSRLRELRHGLYALLMAGILAVFVLGDATRGSRRAIQTPLFEIQFSELGKVLLALVLSAFLVERARRLKDRDTTARAMLFALVPAALVMAEDLGSGLVFVAIAFSVLFVAGVSWRHLTALVALGAASIALVLVAAPATGVEVLKPYQQDRLTSFLHPSEDPGDAGYQQNQSRIAIGSGQKTGRGDAATQTQLNFLPEHHTDFAFAVVGERWGFAGAALVLSLYALLIWRAMRILTIAKNLFGALVVGGIVGMLLCQVFVNVGMNVGIMPITGIPLPLLSYGGSSVISTFLAIGLLQSIYLQGRGAAALKGRIRT